MKQLVTGDEIRKIEQYVINEIGIPSLVLMERAALSVSEHIKKRFSKKDRICVVCGSGNNGADGVAIARQLLEDDYSVQIVLLGKEEKFSFEMKTQTAILENMKIPYQKAIKQDEKFACYVDAIFGVGLTREITDESILNAIDTINSSDAYIYSVDIPSGIHTDTGSIMGKAVRADETITFTYEKLGLCLYPGKEYAGQKKRKDIGIFSRNEAYDIGHYTYEKEDGAELLKRNGDGNKGTFGKVLVIAGNEEISGACVLCAKAVLKSGAGMVKVLSCEKTLDIMRKTLPEAMVQPLQNHSDVENGILSAVSWADCVVLGPGIGMGEDAYKKVFTVLKSFPENKKLILDADAINLVGKYPELKELTCRVNQLIYTPHLLELSRLLEKDVADLKKNLDTVMMAVMEQSNAIYVCKDSVTRVYQKDKKIFLNSFGNSGMATAGSGDVLAGIIASMVARKNMDIYKGTLLGVHIHSLAGDEAMMECGENSLLAGDILKALPKVLKKMEEYS